MWPYIAWLFLFTILMSPFSLIVYFIILQEWKGSKAQWWSNNSSNNSGFFIICTKTGPLCVIWHHLLKAVSSNFCVKQHCWCCDKDIQIWGLLYWKDKELNRFSKKCSQINPTKTALIPFLWKRCYSDLILSFILHSLILKNGARGTKKLLQVLRSKVAMETFPLRPTRMMKNQTTSKTWHQPSGKHRRFVHKHFGFLLLFHV